MDSPAKELKGAAAYSRLAAEVRASVEAGDALTIGDVKERGFKADYLAKAIVESDKYRITTAAQVKGELSPEECVLLCEVLRAQGYIGGWKNEMIPGRTGYQCSDAIRSKQIDDEMRGFHGLPLQGTYLVAGGITEVHFDEYGEITGYKIGNRIYPPTHPRVVAKAAAKADKEAKKAAEKSQKKRVLVVSEAPKPKSPKRVKLVADKATTATTTTTLVLAPTQLLEDVEKPAVPMSTDELIDACDWLIGLGEESNQAILVPTTPGPTLAITQVVDEDDDEEEEEDTTKVLTISPTAPTDDAKSSTPEPDLEEEEEDEMPTFISHVTKQPIKVAKLCTCGCGQVMEAELVRKLSYVCPFSRKKMDHRAFTLLTSASYAKNKVGILPPTTPKV